VIEPILEAVKGWVVERIGAMGYAGIVLLMAIESANVPLPSEIIMPFSGFLVADGRMNLHWASLSGALGCMLGSAVSYWIGYYGGRPFIKKYGRFIFIREKELDHADAFFARYGVWATFIARLLPIIRTFISFPAGISRMDFGKFLFLSFLGSVPWCYLLTYVGRVLGEHWESIRVYFRYADVVVAAGILVWIAIVWRGRVRAGGKEQTLPASTHNIGE
jgi:membrane protein DedA with SNARE-associated domain